MTNRTHFDVIIIGGSYAGLAAGMALGRAARHVLIIDSGEPCNRQTPFSHNFLTQDGQTPGEISRISRQQVASYDTVHFVSDTAESGTKTASGFSVETRSGAVFQAKKLVFATGIRDLLPAIGGYSECWGISVLHCPYCHGYEVKGEKTGVLGNGDPGFEFVSLLSNWTEDLTLFTNGPSTLNSGQLARLQNHGIAVIETEIGRLEHANGRLEQVIFRDGTKTPLKVLYAQNRFEQQCVIPEMLGCEFSEDGYIAVDGLQKTSVAGIFACGDNTTRLRTVANAVAMGTKAGMAVSKEIILQEF